MHKFSRDVQDFVFSHQAVLGRCATRAHMTERNLGAYYLQTDIWLLVDLTVSKIRWFTTDKSEYTAYNMKNN